MLETNAKPQKKPAMKKTVEILMRKSVEYNIDLNVRDGTGRTAFQNACYRGIGESSIAKTIIDNR